MKNIQQLRINQFLTRVPKPKQHFHITFSNEFVKKLYQKAETEMAQKDSFMEMKSVLKISISSPKQKTAIRSESPPMKLFEPTQNVLKIQKQLKERVNPSKIYDQKSVSLNYSEIQKRYLVDSMNQNDNTLDELEKKPKDNLKIQIKTNDSLTNYENIDNEQINVGKFKNQKFDSNRYVLTSPINKIRSKNFEKIEINGRERELIGIQLRQNSKNKIRRSYKLI